jgi:DNA-binding protein HU-alpha
MASVKRSGAVTKRTKAATKAVQRDETPSTAEVLQLAVPGADDAPAPPVFKMKDLMQALTEGSQVKRSDLREAAGLVCAALGQALQEGKTINLPGLGKITPRKREEKPSGDMLTARIKLAGPAGEKARAERSDEDGAEG